MNHFRKAVATTATLLAISNAGALGAAERPTDLFLANSPGTSVQYITVTDYGHGNSSYLEAISASNSAPDGQVRTETYGKQDGTTLVFRTLMAIRAGDGYTITLTTPEGLVSVQHFTRSTPEAINASIAALSKISRRRLAQAKLSGYNAISMEQAKRLSNAQVAAEAAEAQLKDAQETTGRLSAVARQARINADAAIEESGVGFAQNQHRLAAMRDVDNAERAVAVAQRLSLLAEVAVGDAKADVTRLQVHAADASEQIRRLGASLSNGDMADR